MADAPRRRRPHLSSVLTWIAILASVAAVLAEGIGLRDAGQRLRAQEAREAAARVLPAPAQRSEAAPLP